MENNTNLNDNPQNTEKKDHKNLVGSFLNIWENLKPETKRKVTLAGIGAILITVATSMYYVKSLNSSKTSDNVTKSELAQEKITTKVYIGNEESDKIASISRMYEDRLKQMEMKQKMPDIEMGAEGKTNELSPDKLPYPKPEIEDKNVKNEKDPKITESGRNNKKFETSATQKTPPPSHIEFQNNPPAKPPVIEIKYVNGIESTNIDKEKKTTTDEKKNIKLNYLPSSTILPSTLITGVYAPTMAKGMQNPYPVILRVNDLSFLPNSVRKNVIGCFISGEAYGSLAEERAMIRLLKFSCISDSKMKVIDKPIKGYVAGEDGIVGLQGNVVSKQGKALAMTFVASFLQGVGQGLSQANSSITTNLLGTQTNNVNPGALIKYGAGTGFSESFKMLAEFYMSIVKETAPVIEVKGDRKVDVILTEGIELTTEDFIWEELND